MLDLESAIKNRAYEIWQAEGRTDGQELSHWLRAEQEIKGTSRPTAKPKPRSSVGRKRPAKAKA